MLSTKLISFLSPGQKNAMKLRIYQMQTPLLFLINPRIIEITNKKVEIRIPLSFITKNSWRTMFFAAISSGVDLTGGWAAFDIADKYKVGVLYKDMSIEFLRRVDDDLILRCEDVENIKEGALKAAETGERISVPVQVSGYVYKYSQTVPVIRSKLTLSMKRLLSSSP